MSCKKALTPDELVRIFLEHQINPDRDYYIETSTSFVIFVDRYLDHIDEPKICDKYLNKLNIEIDEIDQAEQETIEELRRMYAR